MDVPKNLRPEEPTLGPLDDLLVDRLRRMIHDDGALFVIDLGIDARVADQVDDPFLAFGLGETEAGGEISVWVLVNVSAEMSKDVERSKGKDVGRGKGTYLMSIR